MALKNKEDSFWFHIADVAIINDKPKFVNKGKVTVRFESDEMINNKQCLKYFVDGPGLENKGGYIWINKEDCMIQQYKIALPDEPGFENGMMPIGKILEMIRIGKSFPQCRNTSIMFPISILAFCAQRNTRIIK